MGKSIETAQATAQKAGFKVKLSVLDAPTDPTEIARMSVKTVIRQSLEPYTQVTSKGETITLYYYKSKPSVPSDKKEEQQDDNNYNDSTDSQNETENNNTNEEGE